ncbi:IS30 family transposase [Bifidobacterium bifidum]
MAGNSFAVGSGRCHRASTAQRGCESRRVSCVRPGVLDGERGAGLVRRLVVREHWSPGRIAGGIAVEWPGLMVFASAIYRAINERRLDPPGLTRTRRGIRARLRHKGKRRHGRGGPEERRGKIPGARPIGQRPEIVGERSGLGDREGDTVVGKGAGACLVTLVDRRSGLLSGGRCAAHAVFRQINLRVVTS